MRKVKAPAPAPNGFDKVYRIGPGSSVTAVALLTLFMPFMSWSLINYLGLNLAPSLIIYSLLLVVNHQVIIRCYPLYILVGNREVKYSLLALTVIGPLLTIYSESIILLFVNSVGSLTFSWFVLYHPSYYYISPRPAHRPDTSVTPHKLFKGFDW